MLSVFKDKVLKRGVEVGSLASDKSDSLFDRLPTFRKIPAYIAGFAVKDFAYNDWPYSGKRGRKNFNITTWKGAINSVDLERIKSKETIIGKIEFESISYFAHDKGYLFNTGSLLFEKENWHNLLFSKV